MARTARQSSSALEPTAPVVDGVLALLVLLLVAAPLLARALSATAAGSAATAVPELRLEINRGGDYALQGQPLGHAALAAALRSARLHTPDLRLRIATADDGDPRALVGALALAEQAGVRNIGSELR